MVFLRFVCICAFPPLKELIMGKEERDSFEELKKGGFSFFFSYRFFDILPRMGNFVDLGFDLFRFFFEVHVLYCYFGLRLVVVKDYFLRFLLGGGKEGRMVRGWRRDGGWTGWDGMFEGLNTGMLGRGWGEFCGNG